MPRFKLTGKPVSEELTEFLGSVYCPVENMALTPRTELVRNKANQCISAKVLVGQKEERQRKNCLFFRKNIYLGIY